LGAWQRHAEILADLSRKVVIDSLWRGTLEVFLVARLVVHTHLLDAPVQECEALETDGTDAATVARERALEQRLGVTFTVGRRDRAQVAATVGCDRELLGI
jgi:hypothetical protein